MGLEFRHFPSCRRAALKSGVGISGDLQDVDTPAGAFAQLPLFFFSCAEYEFFQHHIGILQGRDMGAGHLFLVATVFAAGVLGHGSHESENSKSEDWAVCCDFHQSSCIF